MIYVVWMGDGDGKIEGRVATQLSTEQRRWAEVAADSFER